mmetsp:Transcript_13580/g.40458  ORF Transcript_13580/g.40458 Transcript_13580/m.40458 type:complete len:109 (-) Transcript_13580:24-350(-)
MAGLDDLRPEVLEAQINEEERAVEHLVRSNRELEAFLKETPDPELREAVGENIVIIARKRAALQSLYEKREKQGGPAAPPAPPPPPPAAAIALPPAPAPAAPHPGVYL